jgi:AraC-like DNA-binding protein
MELWIERQKDFELSHSHSEDVSTASFRRHCHSDYELLFFIRGQADYVIEEKRYALKPNTVLFLRPNEYHYLHPLENKPYERVVFSFSDAFIPLAVKERLLSRARVVHADASGPLTERFSSIVRLPQLFDGNVPAELVRAVLLEVVCLYAQTAPATDQAEQDGRLLSVLDYVNRNISSNLSVADIARATFMSPSYLSHFFSQKMKIGIMQYVAMKRVGLAETLLAKNVRPTEVATMVGFEDYSNFYRTYKKFKGKSPTGK